MSGVSSKYKRKITSENRLFQDEWETDYFVVPNKNNAATCLICRESIILKKYNISRHFITKHKSFDETFSPGSALRNEKLIFLKKSLYQEQKSMAVAISQDSAVTKASYEICYILGEAASAGGAGGAAAGSPTRAPLSAALDTHRYVASPPHTPAQNDGFQTRACSGPGASWTWGARGREAAGAGGGALGRSASATLRAAPDLNVDAIKEKLLDHRIPESCV